MNLLKRSTVAAWKDFPDYSSQTFPGIAVTPSGRIIVSWRSAPRKTPLEDQRVLYSISDDGGDTWSGPLDVFTAPAHKGRPGTFRTGYPAWINGKLNMLLNWVDASVPGRPFFKDENSGLLECRAFWAESADNGDTWSELHYIDPSPFEHLSTPTTGPLLALADGEIITQFELNNAYDAVDEWRHLPVLKFSADQGKTFCRHAIPAADQKNNIFYWDQRPLVLKNNTIVNFYWTWDNASSTYLNIHTTCSADNGCTWSEPADTGVPGQAGQPVEFSDGALLLPLVDRTGKPRISARMSLDQGKTFTGEDLTVSKPLDEMQTSNQLNVNGAWDEMSKFSLGLPCGTASGHDTAYVVWYDGVDTDHTNIEFAEIAR